MVQISLKCSLVLLSQVAWLRTAIAVGLRHGASREQLVKQEIATEEWFEGRIDDHSPSLVLPSAEMTSGNIALVDNHKDWPVISPATLPPSGTKHRPPEWQSAVDKESGRTFYFDRATNRSQWDVPEGAIESFPNVLPGNPNRFEDGRRHSNFKMYKGDQVDLTCLVHTGVPCEVVQFGMDLLHSCAQLTGGPSTCVGGSGGGECQCDEGYCSTSTGHCHTDRSTYVTGTFTISTKGTENEYLKMVTGSNGAGYVTLSDDASDSACQWRIIKRPDASHILTTVKYPYSALDFLQACTGEDCAMHVGLTINPEGSEIGTQIKFVQHHLVITDTHSKVVLYFPHVKDKVAAKTAQGCLPHGLDCPTDTGYLVFNPELPSDFLENLEDVDYEYWKSWGLYIMAGVTFSLMLFICWYQMFLDVKGSRFH